MTSVVPIQHVTLALKQLLLDRMERGRDVTFSFGLPKGDDGVRRGTDILIALALGARAVLFGRPVHWGLAAGGEAGVRRVLALLQAELERDLWLCGCSSPAQVTRDLVVPAR